MGYSFNWSIVSAGAPYVTISMLGIAFNSVSIEKLGKPEKVMIGFDENALVLGIRPYHDESGIKGYEFANREKNGWVRIGCRDFIKYLASLTGTDFSKAHIYVAEFDKESKCLVVKLMHNDAKSAILNSDK